MTSLAEQFSTLRTVLTTRDDVDFGTPVTSDEVRDAEVQLGTPFPTDYRMFLTEFGSVSIAHYEIFGLGTDIDDTLDVVRITKMERDDFFLPPNLIVVMNDGGGNLTCLDADNMHDGSCAIVVHWHER